MWVMVFLAALGLVASLAVHFSTFLGVDEDLFPYVWLLHVGAIAICIPAAVLQTHSRSAPGRALGGKGSAKDMCPFAPKWMQRALAVFFVYAFVNFAIFLVREGFASG